MKILIVKTSSLGDIVQSFCVLDDLKIRFPSSEIHFVVEESLQEICHIHPHISKVIPIDIRGKKNLYQAFKNLRQEKYDLLFDLQGNTKSGFITLLARAKKKIGFGYRTVREWPNILVTNIRYDLDINQNISKFYLGLIEAYFGLPANVSRLKILFKLEEKEKIELNNIRSLCKNKRKILVSIGSFWENKKVSLDALREFLETLEETQVFFIFGNEKEKEELNRVKLNLKDFVILEKLKFALLQNVISLMDLFIGVDSFTLHLAATTNAKTLSIFGPTKASIFKPSGKRHIAVQGTCPYQISFQKVCPKLRSCQSGACIKNISPLQLSKSYKEISV